MISAHPVYLHGHSHTVDPTGSMKSAVLWLKRLHIFTYQCRQLIQTRETLTYSCQ